MAVYPSHTAVVTPWTSRSYETESDFEQMQGLLMEARWRTNDWHYAHVGDLMWEYFLVTCHLKPQDHVRLWHKADGQLVGYAVLSEDPSLDWQVLPEFEWAGIETEALVWAEALLTKLRQGEAQPWIGNLVSGTRQDDAQRIAFLEQHAFQHATHVEVNLLRSLDEPIPAVEIPAGYEVRAVAEVGDTSNRAAAEREVWRAWYVGKISDDDYARLGRLPGYHRDLDIVAVSPEGIIAAYVNGWIDPINRIGDLGPVGALPAFRRQGLTRAALLESLRRMQAYGMNRVCVSTGESNIPARRLYESVGFALANSYLEYVKTE
jgi:mycothiol synthase